MQRRTNEMPAAIAFSILGFIFTMICAFINHIIWTISILMNNDPLTVKQGVIMVIGILAPPLGAIHGVYLWFH